MCRKSKAQCRELCLSEKAAALGKLQLTASNHESSSPIPHALSHNQKTHRLTKGSSKRLISVMKQDEQSEEQKGTTTLQKIIITVLAISMLITHPDLNSYW